MFSAFSAEQGVESSPANLPECGRNSFAIGFPAM